MFIDSGPLIPRDLDSPIHARTGKFGLGDHRDSAIYTAHCSQDHRSPTLTIDPSRVWQDIMFTSQYGAVAGTTGLNRLALSDSDRQVRDWFVREAKSLDLLVDVDQMGNMFAIMPGLNPSVPPIGIGSHLDTQPNGGRFDGILGVIGALEVLRTIRESGHQNYAPIAAINWTNEEGARFQPGCTGSAVWAGHRTLDVSHSLVAMKERTNMAAELSRIGYLGETPASHEARPLSAHFELHIEQGSRLEDASQEVGVVTGIQDIRWYVINIEGVQSHAGSTPMPERGDALVAAAKLVVCIEDLAKAHGGVATVGNINIGPGSPNCVPGKAHLTLDLRHQSISKADMIESHIEDKMKELEAENHRLCFTIMKNWHSPAVKFQNHAADCLNEAALDLLGDDKVGRMISFAGHDSAMTAQQVPTTMLFVPSYCGISHAPTEYTSREQCGTGVQVLINAVIAYDQHLETTWELQDRG